MVSLTFALTHLIDTQQHVHIATHISVSWAQPSCDHLAVLIFHSISLSDHWSYEVNEGDSCHKGSLALSANQVLLRPNSEKKNALGTS